MRRDLPQERLIQLIQHLTEFLTATRIEPFRPRPMLIVNISVSPTYSLGAQEEVSGRFLTDPGQWSAALGTCTHIGWKHQWLDF
jgi:hypothetical protein